MKAGGLETEKAMEDVKASILAYRYGKSLETQNVLAWTASPQEDDLGRLNIRGACMPRQCPEDIGLCGLKWTGSFSRNPIEHNLPRAIAGIVLLNPETGAPVTIMDGTLISSVSNGARVGLAAQYLARKDCATLGIVGAGVMAKSILTFLVSVLKELRSVKVYSRTRKHASLLAGCVQKNGIESIAVGSVKEAVESSDVILTATSRTTTDPIVKSSWIKDGSFYILYGWNEPEETVVLNSDKIVVLNWELIKHREKNMLYLMYRKGIISEDDIWAELADIIDGKKSGRETAEERIFFTSGGIAITDAVIASRIYNSALKRNIGKELLFWEQPHVR